MNSRSLILGLIILVPLYLLYPVFISKKEDFILPTGTQTNKLVLEAGKYYKKGTLKDTVKNTLTPAVNNGLSCPIEFPQEIYIPVPPINATCKDNDPSLPSNVDSNYTSNSSIIESGLFWSTCKPKGTIIDYGQEVYCCSKSSEVLNPGNTSSNRKCS